MTILLIGLDGADPLFAPVYFKGFTHTTIKSPVPSTGPAWSSIYTGMTPDEHEVTGVWGEGLTGGKKLSRTGIPYFWEKMDCSCGLYNLPLIHPPREVNGFVIGGFPILTDESYCKPTNLGFDRDEWLENADMVQYGGVTVVKSWRTLFKDYTLLKKVICDQMEYQLKGLERLLKTNKVDFLFCQNSMIDRVLHVTASDPAIRDYAYRLGAEYIQRVMDLYPADKTFLISDHGFNKSNHHIHRNISLFSYTEAPKIMPNEIKDIYNVMIEEMKSE